MRNDAGRVSVWALPASADAAWLAATIGRLSRRYGAPDFTPHLTLYTGRLRAGAALDDPLRDWQPVTARVTGIEHGPEYTRTLYLALEPGLELRQARHRVLVHCQAADNDPFRPHVSLIYGGMDEAQRHAAARELSALPAALRFDAVALVAVPERVENAEHVRQFRRLASHPPDRR